MGMTLTDRCARLRERVVDGSEDGRRSIGQKLYSYLKGYHAVPVAQRDNTRLPAASLAAVVVGFEPAILDGELIVGYNYSDGAFPSHLEQFAHEALDPSRGVDPEEMARYLAMGSLGPDRIAEFLALYTDPADPFRYPYVSVSSEPDLDPSERQLVDEMAAMGICLTHNHSILDYEAVLRLGYAGLLRKVREAHARSRSPTARQAAFYDALELVCAACCGIGRKYADLAESLAKDAEPVRREELLEIARICRRVPQHPATTFREAVQSLWFAHVVNTWEDGINANSLGRLDQILHPYYRRDLDAGVLTREAAFELVCCLWLKLYRDYDVQQSTVGGCDRSGADAVNDLSYLMLDATEALDFIRCLSVRFSQTTPKAFLRRALEVVGHVGKGIPFFFNDDVMVRSLALRGIALEDARDYACIGCVETCIPGRSNPHAVSARINVLKALEYALNDGRSLFDETRTPGARTGGLAGLGTLASLKEAVYRQIDRMVDVACRQTNHAIGLAAERYPLAYKSLLTEDCIEKGLDFNAGGPRYVYYQLMVLGIPNLADSLAAIDKLVYREKRYSLEELVRHLRADFPDEAVRLDFLNKAPKFGNDDPDVDRLAAEIMEYACRQIQAVPSTIGQGFHPQPFTYVWMVDHGRLTGATPDGRRKGEILAYSVSPMQGRDFNGFTSLLNSLSSLPTTLAPGTTSAIVEVDPVLFTDRNLDLFVALLMASAKRGLANIQFNTIDRETLVDAKRHPERHRNLAVRVSGFSQKFHLLDEAMQDHIIQRTKHKEL
jgi:pyruvate-formate lyase